MEKAAEALKVDGDPSKITRQLQEQQVGESFKKTSLTGNLIPKVSSLHTIHINP